ncbi:aminoacyl-tRNA hydrolase [Aureimonas sp. SA4125]|uniref:alternative ribosome rescue aminoacyl-tRNA hydrolase ArfB n=1 Tax=Aureimonas sp. SA4125 TaxID=2826993 RepID=UPI001CC529F9|nr:alternative ribosome rescue aminoacyl-tRNA hydrolase ArfB [Aureimonas sp. SA4125]BDA87038.1 aminoacyl-tRNA hydrolase [Aureimonas sp. SA4125]
MSEEDEGLRINPRLLIPGSDFEESFIRASGPGGQNVNKVSSAVQLRFNARGSRALADDVAVRLMRLAGSRTTKAGEILIEASRFRTQERNREDARERLADLIRQALVPPPPPRKKTRPSKGSVERRLTTKRVRADVKKGRGRVDD